MESHSVTPLCLSSLEQHKCVRLTSPKPRARPSQPAAAQAPAGSFEAAENMLQMGSRDTCSWPWPCCLPAGCVGTAQPHGLGLTSPSVPWGPHCQPLAVLSWPSLEPEKAHKAFDWTPAAGVLGPRPGVRGPHSSMYSLKLWSAGRSAHFSTCSGKSGCFLGAESYWRPHSPSRLQM